MGEFREIRWTWQARDNNLRTGYQAIDGRISIADLIAHLRDVAPGVPLDDIHANWATVTWTRPANPDELEQRRLVAERHDQRHEEWERKLLHRLIEKYGAPDTADPS